MFQTVPDMIWMKDAEGRYVACNAATERFFVLPASAIIGRKDHEIFPSEIADVIRAEDRAAIAAGSLLLAHAWVPVGDDGRQVLLETNKTPMLDGEGRLAGILCVARDVTAAHMAQEVLRQRVALAQQLEKTAAAAPGALFSFCQRADGTWFLPYASPAFEDVYGVPPENYAEDATGYWDLLHPEDLDGAVRAIEEARRASSIVRLEYRVRHAKKGERWVEGRAVPVAQPDGSTVWYGFVTDISDRKLAEAALEEGVARRRILFEQSKDGIAILDLNGKVQEANQAFAHLLGYTQEEMRELHVWDWNAQWTREELLSKVAGFFAVPATFETRHRRKDGSLLDVEVSASGVEFGGRKFVYSMARDITIRKAADAALRESRRLEGIGILAGGMAHEFNNLLTVINGYSSLLLRGFDVHDPVRVQIDAIRAAGERAANLTQQLLAFGRKQIIRPAVLDLNMVVERSRPAWMPLLRPNISLRMEPDPSAGLVSIDADRMREVIVNLVTNAIQALPNGGELMIATANVHIGEDYVARHADAQPGWYVMLSVADTGIGMDEKTRARVFEPFFTTRGRAIATGLGLATVHGSVAQHRGWITVESALGKGSVFKIYLPRAGERAEPDGSAADLSGIPNRRATVLVVDEEDAVRRLTVSILKAHGYQTLEAANGSHALAAAEGHKGPIQLILTDVILPGMTGRELARQLRARMPAAKVLYVSGYPEDVIASHAGEGAFIQKPYSPDLLLAKVAEMLD
ncbi:MAG: PAS domain S-box protein [Candidatus Solibacter sp.]|nr:PAS domain S-box protein [Candidatus Solibacter sp.]